MKEKEGKKKKTKQESKGKCCQGFTAGTELEHGLLASGRPAHRAASPSGTSY